MILQTCVMFGLVIITTVSGYERPFRTDAEVYRYWKNKNYTRVGDMIVRPKSARTSPTYLGSWPDHTVPYVISNNVTRELRKVIAKAIEHYHNYTCVIFRKAVRSSDGDKYWIRFMMDPDLVTNPDSSTVCSAILGFQNKEDQGVYLGNQCRFGSMVHELEHTLGFEHEMTRPDRDDYVTIYDENMEDDDAREQYLRDDIACKKYGHPCEFETYDVPFNYDSIMNYCKQCGGKDGATVMESTNNESGLGAIDGSKLGQSFGFSEGDWMAINRKYGCNLDEQTKPPPIPENPPMDGPGIPFPTPKPTPKPNCRRRYKPRP